MGQHLHRSKQGGLNPNHCSSMAKWVVLGKLWGKSWHGIVVRGTDAMARTNHANPTRGKASPVGGP